MSGWEILIVLTLVLRYLIKLNLEIKKISKRKLVWTHFSRFKVHISKN